MRLVTLNCSFNQFDRIARLIFVIIIIYELDQKIMNQKRGKITTLVGYRSALKTLLVFIPFKPWS